jgi:hypothetical protein
MHRRSFVAVAGATMGAPITGCIGENSGDPTSTDQLAAEIEDVSSEFGSKPGEEFVDGAADCANRTATINGAMAGSGCYTVGIQSIEQDGSQATLTLYPEWDLPGEPGSRQCPGETDYYDIRVNASDQLPTTIEVFYDRDGEKTAIGTVSLPDC